jgi:hypothetical protein
MCLKTDAGILGTNLEGHSPDARSSKISPAMRYRDLAMLLAAEGEMSRSRFAELLDLPGARFVAPEERKRPWAERAIKLVAPRIRKAQMRDERHGACAVDFSACAYRYEEIR